MLDDSTDTGYLFLLFFYTRAIGIHALWKKGMIRICVMIPIVISYSFLAL